MYHKHLNVMDIFHCNLAGTQKQGEATNAVGLSCVEQIGEGSPIGI